MCNCLMPLAAMTQKYRFSKGLVLTLVNAHKYIFKICIGLSVCH